MKVIYPATIEKIDDQYWLGFPDLEGCQTWGDSIEDTMSNAIEALGGYVQAKLENGLSLCPPSDMKDIKAHGDVIKTYVCCDVEIKATTLVKKTLTIPDWVNQIGVENHINFSQTLTEAIIKQFQLR